MSQKYRFLTTSLLLFFDVLWNITWLEPRAGVLLPCTQWIGSSIVCDYCVYHDNYFSIWLIGLTVIEHSSPIWLLKFPFSPGWKIGRKMCFSRLVPACYIWGSSVQFSCWLVFEFKLCWESSSWGFMWISCYCQGKQFFCCFQENKFLNRWWLKTKVAMCWLFIIITLFFFFF